MKSSKELYNEPLEPFKQTLIFEYCLLTDTARKPVKNDPDAVGWDVYPDTWKIENGYLEIFTNVVVKPPAGYYFGFYPRSSQTNRNDVFGNSVGIIEPDFRGGLRIRLKPVGRYLAVDDKLIWVAYNSESIELDEIINRDKALGQLVLHPLINAQTKEVNTVEELGITNRGAAGFGSTDKK